MAATNEQLRMATMERRARDNAMGRGIDKAIDNARQRGMQNPLDAPPAGSDGSGMPNPIDLPKAAEITSTLDDTPTGIVELATSNLRLSRGLANQLQGILDALKATPPEPPGSGGSGSIRSSLNATGEELCRANNIVGEIQALL